LCKGCALTNIKRTQRMNRKTILTIVIFGILLTSCSRQSLMKIITKTPKIDYKNIEGFKSFSDYHKDAIYAVNVIKETYPRLYQKVPDFDKKSNQFIKTSSKIKNEKQFDIELKKFISILKDGHSNFSINFSKYDKTKYGLYIFKEKENWIIGNIDKEIDSVVIGKKIVSINNIPIKEIEQRIISFESGENKYWKYKQFLYHYKFPTYWEALKVISPQNTDLNFIVENKEGISKFILKDKEKREGYKLEKKKSKYPYRNKQNNGFYDTIFKSEKIAYIQMNTSLDYVSIKSEINNYTNFITRPIALSFLKKDKKDARNFGEFLQSFFKRIQEENIESLIIDLSYNTGGDERTGKQLIWYLTEKQPKGFTEYINNSEYFKVQIKEDYRKYNELYKLKFQTDLPRGEVNITKKLFDEPYFNDITKEKSPFLLDNTIPKFKGKIYVIISPKTFSAGQVLATTIADNKLAIIIGKSTGNKPTSQTGASMFKLPNTKKIIAISYTYMERPDKTKNNEKALYPNIEINNTFKDFLNGNDRIMEYILNENQK